MNLEETIIKATTDKLSDGTVETLIEENIKNTISEVIRDLFRWGDAEKVIKEKFKEVIVPAIESYDFSEYTQKLDVVMTDIVKNTVYSEHKAILDNFKSIMLPPKIERVTVTEIFEKFKEYVSKNINTSNLKVCCEDRPYYSSPTVTMDITVEEKCKFINSSFKDAEISFECEEDDKLNFVLKIHKFDHEGKWNISSYGEHLDLCSLRYMGEFELYLFTLRTSSVEIIIDARNEIDEVEVEAEPECTFE